MKSLLSISQMRHSLQRQSVRIGGPRRGFTLMQLMLVMALIALLATFLISAFGQSRETAHRAECDMRLKAITMALDAHRQESGHYPEQLSKLVERKFLTDALMLKCPADPRPKGSYDDFYVMRSGRGSNELPILLCPLCATESGQAMQAFQGRYTKQFATRPAELTKASATTIERPGKNPISGRAGMQLRGGDTIRTGDGGQAVVRFADGSVSEMSGGSEITVLQSFIAGHMRAPLYTLINQKIGDVRYRVHHGSKFDVTTPTATAGALGTEFQIKSDSSNAWWLKVIQSKVYVTNLDTRVVVTPTAEKEVNLANTEESRDSSPTMVSTQWVPIGQEQMVATSTPSTSTPAATATPTPTATPGSSNPVVAPTPTATAMPTATPISTSNANSSTKKKRTGHGTLKKIMEMIE